MKRIFVAGATGAVGTVFVPRARAAGLEVLPHVRPQTAAKHPLGQDPQAQIFELTDAARSKAALAEVDAVVCLVGTTRKRFSSGDTYATSDLQPVIALADAGVDGQPKHFVLLSSYGAREGSGYLGWKWKAEEALRARVEAWTILRPSILDARGSGSAPSDVRSRGVPPLLGGALRGLGHLPGLSGLSDDLRPIPLTVLADALVRIVIAGAPKGAVLTGRRLWPLGS